MKILFASAEVAPIIKVGGLADVAGSLPLAIKKLGHDIRIVMPRYEVIDENKFPMKLVARDIPVTIGQEKEKINIYQTNLPDSRIPVYLLENKKYLTKNGVYYEATEFANVQRFLFFSKAVLEVFEAIDFCPEIIHCQDWHTSAIPLFLKLKKEKRFKILLTIHNLGMQGQWNYEETLKFLDFRGDEAPSLGERFFGPFGDDFNTMQQGILNADVINTVSPTYAQEILTQEKFGHGLTPTVQKRKSDFHGILNGLNTEVWNPAKDPNIKTNYTSKSLEKKIENKLALQKTLGLSSDIRVPLLGMITRLAEQKGVDLVCQIIDDVVNSGGQMVFLGTGEEELEERLADIGQGHPDKVSANIKFDAKLARQIYAGTDIFLMPSRFEPCGLGQLIAMRYGTIPVVRATGGLKDTVRDVKIIKKWFLKAVEGNGFVFETLESKDLFQAIKRSLEFYKNPKIWRKIQLNAMNQDFSWDKSAVKYIELYKKLL
jgi:starch synthase